MSDYTPISLIRGNSTVIDETSIVDGQILFDESRKCLFMDDGDTRSKYSGLGADSNVATVEDTTTSTHTYAKGDYVVVEGQLYEVTAAIAIGDTFTVGTNITQTTVGDELVQIKSDLGKVYKYTFTFTSTDTNRTSLNKLYATLSSFDSMSIRDARFELNFGQSGRGSDIYRLERAMIDKSYYEFITIMTLSTGIRIVGRTISNGTSSASDTKIETTGTSMNDITNNIMGLSGEYNLIVETI